MRCWRCSPGCIFFVHSIIMLPIADTNHSQPPGGNREYLYMESAHDNERGNSKNEKKRCTLFLSFALFHRLWKELFHRLLKERTVQSSRIMYQKTTLYVSLMRRRRFASSSSSDYIEHFQTSLSPFQWSGIHEHESEGSRSISTTSNIHHL